MAMSLVKEVSANGMVDLAMPASDENMGNFQFIYSSKGYRDEFYNFLVNVFHLYPEQPLHQAIAKLTDDSNSDRVIYERLQRILPDIKPLLADLTYAVPALLQQKEILGEQSLKLLDPNRRYDGYLEFGSGGRYLDDLEERLDLVGERFMVAERKPNYSITDQIDRGQVCIAGSYIPLGNYQTDLGATIAPSSIDLVTVFIGFHHCPIDLRGDFLASIRTVMRPGAYLVVRDHHAHDKKMVRMVALAHDVFNMGTRESWGYNDDELRNFYDLGFLHRLLISAGFAGGETKLYQSGDPTLNALMVYRKV